MRSARRIIPVAAASLLGALLASVPISGSMASPQGEPAATPSASPRACVPAPNADCRRADLRGRNLAGRNLRGIDLRGADLTGANLRRADLRRANLRGAELVDANLRLAKLRNADVRGADFGGAELHGTQLGGARLNSDDQDVIVFPDEIGKVEDVIDSAAQTVDLVIYEAGGPNLVGQESAPGALMRAVSRGVKVRVIVNGGWRECTFDDSTQTFTNQFTCATVYTRKGQPPGWQGTGKASWAYAVRESLMAAYAAPQSGVTPQLPEVNFANNNFNVTHQKTLIIDGTYSSGPNAGEPRSAGDMLATSQALVMTGNLLSLGWGEASTSADDTTWMGNPASTCRGGPCPIENTARDFGVPVDDPVLIGEISRIFASDFICGAGAPGGAPSRTNTNGLLGTALPLTWSNGSYQDRVGSTPSEYPSPAFGYQYPTNWEGQTVYAQTVQGNVRGRMLDLINGAQESLLLYNEEFSDDSVIAAVTAAAQRLGAGNVKLIMTWSPMSKTDTRQPLIWSTWRALADAGVSIMLSEYADPYTQDESELYVHAKMILADSADAYVGSTNFTSESMDWNRELGVRLTNRENPGGGWIESVQGMADLMTQFKKDFSDTKNMTSWATIEPQLPPKEPSASSSVAMRSQQIVQPASSGVYYDTPQLCGPLPMSDAPLPLP